MLVEFVIVRQTVACLFASSGDETSSLDIAQGMRARLIKLHETIDLIRLQ